MRHLIAIAAISACTLMVGAQVAPAEITYPWCADYSAQHGGRNCGFSTWEQCWAAVSGNGGYCEANPMYQPLRRPPPASALRR